MIDYKIGDVLISKEAYSDFQPGMPYVVSGIFNTVITVKKGWIKGETEEYIVNIASVPSVPSLFHKAEIGDCLHYSSLGKSEPRWFFTSGKDYIINQIRDDGEFIVTDNQNSGHGCPINWWPKDFTFVKSGVKYDKRDLLKDAFGLTDEELDALVN